MVDSADLLEVLPFVLGFGLGAGLPTRARAVVGVSTRAAAALFAVENDRLGR